ncbi:apolipoprotein N-acyltransferase [Corynebacterium sphenisci]|uniref:apolipoprotein N-acyltransferase n=1 Tax=Corynebacterium sphenisci TaxID=191493 RepID=UPI0009531E43|nr:apolipoprotein N-acyltransferase [Corynebacterium sphenisci]
MSRPGPRAAAALRLAAGAASGAALAASFAPIGFTPGGPAAVALLIAALTGRPSWPLTLTVGFAHGAAAALVALGWIGSFVGAGPWLALCALLGLIQMATAAGIRVIRGGRLPGAVSAAGAAAWVIAVEALLGRWPFGGFPWLRLAFGQVDGPLAQLAAIGGAPLVGLAAALIGAGVAEAARPGAAARHRMAGAGLAAAALAAGLAAPHDAGGPGEPVRVAAVQGNVPRLGLEFNAQRRAVLENHVAATRELAEAVAAGREPRPDLVIWPENSADVSPLTDPAAARLVASAQAAIGAPILVGTFSYDGAPRNAMIVWDDDGAGERHEKKRLQPFGEWMPYRGLLRHVTDLVDLAGDLAPGSGDGVVHARGIALGVATCYEVVFDQAFRESAAAGARLLATPTNNATFGFTGMTYQQLAMSRLRAIEHRRAVVVAATSGVSAIIDPDGAVLAETGIFERAVLTSTLPLRDDPTMASRHGAAIEACIAALALLAAAAAVSPARRSQGVAAQQPDARHHPDVQ